MSDICSNALFGEADEIGEKTYFKLKNSVSELHVDVPPHYQPASLPLEVDFSRRPVWTP